VLDSFDIVDNIADDVLAEPLYSGVENKLMESLKLVEISDVLDSFIKFLTELLSIPIMFQFCALILLVGVFCLLRRFFRIW
jgi:hypothetical protein